MFKINTVYKMNGGGGCYDRLQNIICTIALFLLLVINIFAEVPHTTIVENPSKEVTKVETLKRKDKAELNITVEKKKSKEIVGYVDGNKVIIPKSENPQVNFEDTFEVMDNLQGKISKNYKVTTTEKGIEIEGSKVANFLYLIGKTGTWKWNNRNITVTTYSSWYEGTKYLTKNLEIDDRYKNTWIYNSGTYNNINNSRASVIIIDEDGIIKDLNKEYNIYSYSGTWLASPYSRTVSPGGPEYGYCTGVKTLSIENKIIAEGSYNSEIVNINNEILLQIGGERNFKFKLLKYPEKDFKLTFFLSGVGVHTKTIYQGGGEQPIEVLEGHNMSQQLTINFKYILRTLKGQSTLEVKEKYPTNQYIAFNSTKFEEGKPLALENSLTDVTFNTTGKGIVTIVEGDILEIDGKQVTIGTGGNLGVQTATIGDLKYSYKVEAGKLRLALNEWGILEPNHDLMIRVFRTENGNQRKMVEHTLTIDSPRRVEGTNNIKIDNNYQIRNVIKFNGISLDTPSSFSLESPIPTGVTLAEQTGYGIPLLDEGDTIQVDDGRTRTVHSYTIQSGGTLASQRIEFSNGSIDLQVVNRKVQVRLNNWKVNEPMRLNLRAIRGVNEISNHAITLTAPEAPFNMLETGNLDFGNVLQGAKNKKAESNIRIEMLAGQDVSEVKFNLREEQPVMTNSQGTELKVKSIDKTVQKVRDREYNIKLRGTLDVPEEQQSGEYRGSNILDIEVK